MKVPYRQPPPIKRCPYLGLHDDESTCLGYASPWNYCYHATPPRSIVLSHQREACLGAYYLDCIVLLSNKWGPLPRNLRGKAGGRLGTYGSLSWRLWLILLFLLFVIVALVVWLGQPI